MATYISNASAQIHCTVAGVNIPPVKSWTTWEGGDPVSSTGQLNPGAGMGAVAIPGLIKKSRITVTRPYTAEVDAIVEDLKSALNSSVSAWYTPTDGDGNPNGVTHTETGLLAQVQIPKWDGEGGGGKSPMLGLIIEVNS